MQNQDEDTSLLTYLEIANSTPKQEEIQHVTPTSTRVPTTTTLAFTGCSIQYVVTNILHKILSILFVTILKLCTWKTPFRYYRWYKVTTNIVSYRRVIPLRRPVDVIHVIDPAVPVFERFPIWRRNRVYDTRLIMPTRRATTLTRRQSFLRRNLVFGSDVGSAKWSTNENGTSKRPVELFKTNFFQISLGCY